MILSGKRISGERLTKLRESKLMSVIEVSQKAKINASTVSKIEVGKTKVVRFSTLRKLATAFDMHVDEFAKSIEEEGKPV